MEQEMDNRGGIRRFEEVLSVNWPVAVFAFTGGTLACFGMFSWTEFLIMGLLGIYFAIKIARVWEKYCIARKELEKEIKKRETAESSLKDNQTMLRICMENAPYGIAIICEGIFRYVNPKHVAIFGYGSGDDLLYRTIDVNVHPDDVKIVKENILQIEKGELAQAIFKFKGVQKDGKSVHVEISMAMTSYYEEKAVIAFIRDVTHEKDVYKNRNKMRFNIEQGHCTKIEIPTIGKIETTMPVNGITDIMEPESEIDSADIDSPDEVIKTALIGEDNKENYL